MATTLTAREKVERLVPWRRADPAVPVDATGHTEEAACLNCATPLAGKFCHECGQHAHVHRTLGAFGHDLLHGVLHLEGKVWYTLPKLLFRPGELTRRYIAGERARFVSPLAMFLFSVFLMFAVMGLLGSPQNLFGNDTRDDVQAGMQDELAKIDTKLVGLRRQREQAAARGASTAQLDTAIDDAQTAQDVLRGLAGEDITSPQPAASGTSGSGHQEIASAKVGDQPVRISLNAEEDSAVQTAYSKAYRAAKQNPSLLVYKLQTNAYKFSWALIILSVPFMALLFLWRWRPVYDHTVFITYSITAVSILVIAGSLLALAGVPPQPIMLAATLFIPWHMYRQLRGGYELRRLSALWRTFFLLVFATAALLLFTVGLLMMGVLG